MPRLNDGRLVIYDYPPNVVEFSGRKPSIPSKRHRLEPELGLRILAPDMHMDRLATVETVEEEPVRSGNASDSRHADVRTLMFSGVRVQDNATQGHITGEPHLAQFARSESFFGPERIS
jgi:hypothetical protein